MPAAAVKGIILSISIITALGVAVLENPQIQAWLEQQRQNILELLRNLGEELDPQSRQAAEAFAYEGRTPTNDAGLRREASGSLEAAAIATGRSLSNPTTVRRIPVRGPADAEEAEERRRKGREYLARRNQEMFELKERRKKAAKGEGEGAASTPTTPTSFDALVDDEGKLKAAAEKEKEVGQSSKGKEKLLDLPSLDDVPDYIKAEMKEVERKLVQPLLAGEASSSASAWQIGSRLANPFSDEYAIDRSETPKPPVPPKVAIEVVEEGEEGERPQTPTMPMPGSFTPRQAHVLPEQLRTDEEEEEGENEDLSYEEQLAIALSLSEAEAAKVAKAAAAAAQHIESEQNEEEEEDDADLRAAIAASLKDMTNQLNKTPQPAPRQHLLDTPQPLVDLTPSTPPPSAPLYQPAPRGHWETLFDQAYSPTREPLSMVAPQPIPIAEEDDDELYRVTPQLTHARLASHDSQQQQQQQQQQSFPLHRSSLNSRASSNLMPYDPVREAAANGGKGNVTEGQLMDAMEASFYSAVGGGGVGSSSSPTRSRTMSQEAILPQSQSQRQAQLIDISEDTPAAAAATTTTTREQGPHSRTPTSHSHSHSSFSFRPDEDEPSSDSETFASISAPASRAQSRARSEISDVEVVDLLDGDDSDVDMLSDQEGDGIATPDSWTEVGSRDGESEMGDDEGGQHPNWRLAGL